jgi:hypothetical protein
MSEDVNERVNREWKEDTTPDGRVRRVMRRTYETQSLDEIADRALVDEAVARAHLQRLADDGFVAVEEGEYRRAPSRWFVSLPSRFPTPSMPRHWRSVWRRWGRRSWTRRRPFGI